MDKDKTSIKKRYKVKNAFTFKSKKYKKDDYIRLTKRQKEIFITNNLI